MIINNHETLPLKPKSDEELITIYTANIQNINTELKRYRQTLYKHQSPLRRRQVIKHYTDKRRLYEARIRHIKEKQHDTK